MDYYNQATACLAFLLMQFPTEKIIYRLIVL